MKKIIALILICCMVLPMISASAAATEEPTPTIEEILNEYHAKAFEARAAAENGGASTYARGGNSQTLEQEAVEALTEAGYEAYNVTGDNYDSVEETLNTDLASLGLDPNSSYVVVVSYEDPSAHSSPNARVIHPPLYDDFDDDNSGAGDSIVYNGTKYTLRYVTVTASDYSDLFVSTACMLSDVNYLSDIGSILAEYTLDIACDMLVDKLFEESVELIPYVGTICTLVDMVADVQEAVSANPFTVLNPNALVMSSGTAWTRRYIQIYHENPVQNTTEWWTSQWSSYAVSRAHFDSGYYYDPVTNEPQQFTGILKDTTTYSPYYNDIQQCKYRAVLGYINQFPYSDSTGPIDFYIKNPNSQNSAWKEILLFTHQETAADLLPSRQEG